jgi:putative chitobiose transport system permease protein
MTSRMTKRGTALRYTLLTLILIILAGPLLWQLSLSLKGPGDQLYARPPRLVPTDPTLDNYREVTRLVPVLRYLLNSTLVALISVTANVIGATCAGFALARLRFRGRGAALGAFVAALNVLLMRNAFLAIPAALEEASLIDGANVWQRFVRICGRRSRARSRSSPSSPSSRPGTTSCGR